MKVLKIAAIVVGAVALAATGIGLAVGASVAAGVGTLTAAVGLSGTAAGVLSAALAGAALFDVVSLANLILPKPSQGGEQTKWKADPYAGLPYVMGRTLVAGNIVYRRGSGGSNDYEHFVTVLSVGPIDSIDTIFLNRTTVGFGGDGLNGGAHGTYSGQVWHSAQRGACPEPAALQAQAGNAPGWTAQHKLSGLAATWLTYKYDSKTNGGFTTEPTPGWIVHGVRVYDPRLDSTYPGGNGACRARDETTYVWSENPHLHGLTWALGRWQNGVRVAGIGAAPSQIDIAAFVEGANLDDARGWKLGGQVVTRPDTAWNSLKAMLQAGGATPVLLGGVIGCINRAPRVSLATITRDDIAGKTTLTGTQPRRSRINGVIPQYRSEAHDWEMVAAAGLSIADYVTLDGDERTREIAYPLVQDVDQAAQLATYDICDAREAGPGSIPLKPWWLNFRVGDCVTFQPEDGWSIKVMVTGRAIEPQSGVVTYDVRGETDGKHALALGATGIAPAIATISYSNMVDAPAATDWALAGTTLTAGGGSIPALVATGAVGNASADAALFDLRVVAAGLGSEDGWSAGSIEAPSVTRKELTGITPGTDYQVSVRYRVRGVLGARLILGPVTSGALSVATATNATSAGTANTATQLGGEYQAGDITHIIDRLNAAGIPN